MDLLAEVAAVAVELGSVIGARRDAVIAPLPHEAAVPLRDRLEDVLVLGHGARAVAHRVHVLAQDHGALRELRVAAGHGAAELPAAGSHVEHRFDRRVHARDEFGVLAVVVLLVVHGALRVSAAQPVRHLCHVRAGVALVAE